MKAAKIFRFCLMSCAAGALGAMALINFGCASPGYSAGENVSRISRNMDFEAGLAVDDWDHFWLLRPASTLTAWNVQTEP